MKETNVWNNKNLLKILPFCNILIEKPEIKRLSNAEASKSSIKDPFKDLLYEMKVFKYQITLNMLLSKEKINGDTEYSSVYFNSITKTVINLDFDFDKALEEI